MLHRYLRTDLHVNSRFISIYAYILHNFFFQVLSVLSTIELTASTKQCFNIKESLFVRNKWDRVDGGKQERELLKMKLTDWIKKKLPWVRERQIFDLCLMKV